MADLLTHIQRSLAVDVDLDLEPQCELSGHVLQPEFHGGPAAYLAVPPCKRPRLVCAAFKAAVVVRGTCYCERCSRSHRASDVRFIEL